jgi:hypothetical protein
VWYIYIKGGFDMKSSFEYSKWDDSELMAVWELLKRVIIFITLPLWSWIFIVIQIGALVYGVIGIIITEPKLAFDIFVYIIYLCVAYAGWILLFMLMAHM